VSGNPTIVKLGSPLDTWISTDTAQPEAPLNVAEAMEASIGKERSSHFLDANRQRRVQKRLSRAASRLPLWRCPAR
jgi:hypothetical protein